MDPGADWHTLEFDDNSWGYPDVKLGPWGDMDGISQSAQWIWKGPAVAGGFVWCRHVRGENSENIVVVIYGPPQLTY